VPRGGDEYQFGFRSVINNEVIAIAAHICKKAGVSLHMVKKSRSPLLIPFSTLAVLVVALVVYIGFFYDQGEQDDSVVDVFGEGMMYGTDGFADDFTYDFTHDFTYDVIYDFVVWPPMFERVLDFKNMVNDALWAAGSALHLSFIMPDLHMYENYEPHERAFHGILVFGRFDAHNLLNVGIDPANAGEIIHVMFSGTNADEIGEHETGLIMATVVSALTDVSADDANDFLELLIADGNVCFGAFEFAVFSPAPSELVLTANR